MLIKLKGIWPVLVSFNISTGQIFFTLYASWKRVAYLHSVDKLTVKKKYNKKLVNVLYQSIQESVS